jgi:hypothetical protein
MPYDASDGYRTLVLRVCTATKSATLEGFQTLSQGDSLKLVLSEIPGADLDSLKAYLFSKGTRPVPPATTPAATSPAALVTPATGFQVDPDTGTRLYATWDISSATLTTALQDLLAGEALTARLYVADDNAVWVDCDIGVLPAPHLAQVSWPDPEAPFARTDDIVLRADLLAGVTPIIAMPTLTASQREARLVALLTLLSTLAQPE